MKRPLIIIVTSLIALCIVITIDIFLSWKGEPYDDLIPGKSLKGIAQAINSGRGATYVIEKIDTEGPGNSVVNMVVRKGGVKRLCKLTMDGSVIRAVEFHSTYIRHRLLYDAIYGLFKKDTAAPLTQLDLPDEATSPEDENAPPVPANESVKPSP